MFNGTVVAQQVDTAVAMQFHRSVVIHFGQKVDGKKCHRRQYKKDQKQQSLQLKSFVGTSGVFRVWLLLFNVVSPIHQTSEQTVSLESTYCEWYWEKPTDRQWRRKLA